MINSRETLLTAENKSALTDSVKYVLRRAVESGDSQVLRDMQDAVETTKRAVKAATTRLSDDRMTRQQIKHLLDNNRAEQEAVAELSTWENSAASADALADKLLKHQLDYWRFSLIAAGIASGGAKWGSDLDIALLERWLVSQKLEAATMDKTETDPEKVQTPGKKAFEFEFQPAI